MKAAWSLLLLLAGTCCYGQDGDKYSMRSRMFSQTDTSCYSYYYNLARADIAAGTMKLLIIGGFAPRYYATDSAFERRYHVSYYLFGCVVPDKAQCLEYYNELVMSHLDKQYGKKWRKKVRRDVMGLKDKKFEY